MVSLSKQSTRRNSGAIQDQPSYLQILPQATLIGNMKAADHIDTWIRQHFTH